MSDSPITRDVVLDLLPAVRSGTASAESRQIVERFLAKDPEFAARIATMPFPSAELEMQALHRTRGRIKRGGVALGLAIFFTALPFAFVYADGGLKFQMLRDAPIIAVISFVAGVAFWMGFVKHRGDVA